jgi:hypothetical protein
VLDSRRRAGARIAAVLGLCAVLGAGCALGFRNPDGGATSDGGTRISRPADGPPPPTVGDERLRAALNDARPYRWERVALRVEAEERSKTQVDDGGTE